MLETQIKKIDGQVMIDYTDNGDIHEVIGLLASSVFHLTCQEQGINKGITLDHIIARTPLAINASNGCMQIKVEDFQWFVEQARIVEEISNRLGIEERKLQKARDAK